MDRHRRGCLGVELTLKRNNQIKCYLSVNHAFPKTNLDELLEVIGFFD